MYNRNGSQNRRRPEDLPYPFNTGYYAPVESLPYEPIPYAYEPYYEPTIQEPVDPNPYYFPLEPNLIPPNYRVNHRWEEHVQRVLGYVYHDCWPNLQAMIDDCERQVRTRPPGYFILDGPWSGRNLETAGRLRAWGVPNDVVEVLVGWPVVRPTEEEYQLAISFMRDEFDRLEEEVRAGW